MMECIWCGSKNKEVRNTRFGLVPCAHDWHDLHEGTSKHPHFTMSKYVKMEHLYRDKAKYYQERYDALAQEVEKILVAHDLSEVDWSAMREAKKIVNAKCYNTGSGFNQNEQ